MNVAASPRGERRWSTSTEALRLCFARQTLRKTGAIALIVGTLLSLINQGAVVLDGEATAATWLRVAFNYLIPFCVSSLGFLSASKAPIPGSDLAVEEQEQLAERPRL